MLNLGPTKEKRFFAALDLGQVSDFSTLAVIERIQLVGDWDPVAFAWKKRTLLRLRYLERIPLGTSYPDVVCRVNDVMRQLACVRHAFIRLGARREQDHHGRGALWSDSAVGMGHAGIEIDGVSFG